MRGTSRLHQFEGINHFLDGLVPFPYIFERRAVTMLVKCFECLKTRNNKLCYRVVSVPYLFYRIDMLIASVFFWVCKYYFLILLAHGCIFYW